MTTEQRIRHIRELIGQDNLDAALDQLRQLLANSPQLDEAIHQTGRFQNIQKQIRLGLVNHQDANLTQNQIRAGVLDILREIEKLSIRPYNRQLTRALVEAMRPYHDKAERLCQDFSWLEHPDNLRRVQQFVFQNLVGEVGKQLRKLVNIGDDELLPADKKQRHYVDKCLDIARRCFDLVNFTLLSVWWDAVKLAPRSLDADQHRVVADFFEKHLDHDLEAQCRLLRTLVAIFRAHGVDLPFDGAFLPDALPAGADPLRDACRQLEAAVKAGDAGASEESLCGVVQHFAFLTRYRMASIKKIGYRQIRNGQPEYLHRYVALGIDVKYSEDAEKGKWIELGERSPAILLYQGDDYRNGINLFPFIIDFNALTFEQGAKICFFSTRDLNDDGALLYRFLGDNSTVRIEKRGIHAPGADRNELMMNPEHLKTFNLDCVVDGFQEARRTLLGEDADFFDQL